GEPFAVEGRVQLDRAGAPGAPWQETLISFPESGRWAWVAAAQGRWYATSEVPLPPGGVPHWRSLRPGRVIDLGQYGSFTVAEVGQRRVISAEGELPNVAAPGQVTRFADVGGPNGAFGTIDYGDDQKIPVALYLGRQIDPAVMQLDSGAPVEAAQAKVEALACPNCGGNLPIVAPGTTERVVCRYCGMTSDLNQGALVALKPAPKPPFSPAIPLGAEGTLRGTRTICIGFTVRGCTVEGERYRWREYLLYAGERVGYLWLMEEDGAWQYVTPIPPGAVQADGRTARLHDRTYRLKQSVRAEIEYVVGEFYWKVEIGEAVRATDYEGPGGIVSVEEDENEVVTSFCERISPRELEQAFGVRLAGAAFGGAGPEIKTAASAMTTIFVIGVVVFILFIICAVGVCGGGSAGSGSGGPSVGPHGPAFGGK
ncbi:MAG TPA: DUF4178 domain-containing protein, partial [Minicystis sp.]|nr:DUF4178 domain-containing protein [Minicystis sp.]